MKILSFVIIYLLLGVLAYGQSGLDYFERLPAPPSGTCEMTPAQMSDFLKQVNAVIKDINVKILEKRKRTNDELKMKKNQIEKNVAQQYGFSESDVQKLKSKNVSKAQKKAIANNVLQEKTGISMEEIKKLKTMSKEGKTEWAKAYAEQQQASLSAGEKGEKSPEQIEMEKKMKTDKQRLDLVKEQKKITDKIAASDRKFTNNMNEFLKKDSIEQITLKMNLVPLEAEMNGLPGPSEERAKQISAEIRSKWGAYCTKVTPFYIKICKDAYQSLLLSMADYDRLEEITNTINSQFTGVQQPYESQGLMQLEAVKSYASLLLNVFNYGARQGTPNIPNGN